MRILPRKAFLFEVGLDSYQCIPGMIQDCPDKFRNSAMYKLAAAEGSIEVIDSRAALIKAENDVDEGKPKAKAEDDTDKPKAEGDTDKPKGRKTGDAK